MLLVINGEERRCAALSPDLPIEGLGMRNGRVAVELNRNTAPRASWRATALQDGARLEIVRLVGGG